MMLPAGSPSISFVDSIKICMQGFVKCEGRARRSEFWWFYMVCTIIMVFLSFFIGVGGTGYFIFWLIVDIVIYIPIISASTRRLHDIGMTGFYNLLMLIPFGIFVLWYFWSIDSHRTNNIYGPATKYGGGAPTDPLLANPQAPVVGVPPIGQPGYSPVQPMVYPGQQPIPVSPNVYPGQQPIPVSPNVYPGPQSIPTANPNYNDQQNIPVAQPNYNNQQNIPVAQPNYNDQQNIPVAQPNYNEQQNIPVAQPNGYPQPQQNIPVAQPNAYPQPQQNIPVAQPNAYPQPQQNIPVAQPNGYPQPQQNIPVAQPNAMVDKPEGEVNYPQIDPQNQAPMVPPPQNPPNY